MFGRNSQKDVRRHAEVLASTARMELELGVGDWRQTVAQMNELLSSLESASARHASEVTELTGQMRKRISLLEQCIHKREYEYDQLQERYCALRDRIHADA